VTFHDGNKANATAVAAAVRKGMVRVVPNDLASVEAPSDNELVMTLKQRSSFLLELLDEVEIGEPGSPEVGTGAFKLVQGPGGVEVQANDRYYLGRPAIDRIRVSQYPTVRAAWADMLRGQVDMLYEVGIDALDSLTPASNIRVYPYRSHRALIIAFNVNRPALRSRRVRQALNSAVDRAQIIKNELRGHGTPFESPVWPLHWAYDSSLPQFRYDPAMAAAQLKNTSLRFTCVFPQGPEYERVALAVQRQLRSIGVQMDLEVLSQEAAVARVLAGDFDVALLNALGGPSLGRVYLWWHSDGTYNFGKFRSKEVDAALDQVRRAPDDTTYRTGVAAYQRAIVEDPPAIFIVWQESARALSTRFEVPLERGQDIWISNSVRLWRPVGGDRVANRN
jgi:peptide/nickel transport system substrate-binding protein